MPRKTGKRRHVPQRTCVGCREILPKRSMVRIVRSPQGVVIDHTGKLAGRGAYLHLLRPCWERGLKGALANALKVELTQEERERLTNFAVSLPEPEPTMNE
ncbi:MAG: YlxR family protein [Anaerolineales bacterium]